MKAKQHGTPVRFIAFLLVAALFASGQALSKTPSNDQKQHINNAPCGANCLYAAFAILGIEVDYTDIVIQSVDAPGK